MNLLEFLLSSSQRLLRSSHCEETVAVNLSSRVSFVLVSSNIYTKALNMV